MQNKSLKNPEHHTGGKSWSLEDAICFKFVALLHQYGIFFSKWLLKKARCTNPEMLPVIRQLGGLEIFSITLLFPCQFFMFSTELMFWFCLHCSCRQDEWIFFPSHICQPSPMQHQLLQLWTLGRHRGPEISLCHWKKISLQHTKSFVFTWCSSKISLYALEKRV